MTEQEITNGNKLIAEFMGLSYCTKYMYEGWYKNSEHNHRICDFDGLKYHSSWDWLMPVVEKIESIKVEGYSINFSIMYTTANWTPAHWGGLKTCLGKSKIEAVWFAVIEFIKWYNKNK